MDGASLQTVSIVQARSRIAVSCKGLLDIPCPPLVVHAREDENAIFGNALEMMQGVCIAMTRPVLLQDCCRMVSVDREKETMMYVTKDFLASVSTRAAIATFKAEAVVLPFTVVKTGALQ